MPKPRGNSRKLIRPKLHIFCEGEKTEPCYFNGYLSKFHSSNRLLQVVKVEKTNKNTPVQLVEEAIKLKSSKETPDGDVFWVVYDREAKSKYADSLHAKARNNAIANNIELAITNVCFEVWILLHFIESSAQYTSCDNFLQKSDFKKILKGEGIKSYSKSDASVFDLISNRIPDARERSKRMNQSTLDASNETEEIPHLLNPYSNVHQLLTAIDDFVL